MQYHSTPSSARYYLMDATLRQYPDRNNEVTRSDVAHRAVVSLANEPNLATFDNNHVSQPTSHADDDD